MHERAGAVGIGTTPPVRSNSIDSRRHSLFFKRVIIKGGNNGPRRVCVCVTEADRQHLHESAAGKLVPIDRTSTTHSIHIFASCTHRARSATTHGSCARTFLRSFRMSRRRSTWDVPKLWPTIIVPELRWAQKRECLGAGQAGRRGWLAVQFNTTTLNQRHMDGTACIGRCEGGGNTHTHMHTFEYRTTCKWRGTSGCAHAHE